MSQRVDLRCPSCGRLLLKMEPSGQNNMEIRCTRCKAKVEVDGYHVGLSQPGTPRRVDERSSVA